ncbi:MAG: sigma-70 family RNA polymerase sigma factor [Deltaproteobacteria bacterium]|nr:sigma-70 family RNA polymerase sigma factor [Deltaproteobacteria bacterium]MBW2309625.1 sigma-70 family RNA polymerase sigma factor [Deltaproteobacteria bacterium]
MDDETSTFGELVERHQKRVFQVALSILGDKEEALDITQDVFIKAYKAYKDFRHDASTETWLIRITINRVRDHLRGEKLKRLLFSRPGKTFDNQIETIADRAPSPLDKVSGNQLRAALRTFQRGLRGRQREVFALRFGSGYTIREIAELTGMSKSSVKTHLYRALARVQKQVSEWSTP